LTEAPIIRISILIVGGEKMNWKEFLLSPAIVFVKGTPEEIKELQRSGQLEKKGLIELKKIN
jgi:hypothetical protein|tara:strand:- start:1869 stop:2054 length:186 start_codon:yes stop_codon:yes gene_type:complete